MHLVSVVLAVALMHVDPCIRGDMLKSNAQHGVAACIHMCCSARVANIAAVEAGAFGDVCHIGCQRLAVMLPSTAAAGCC